MTRYFNEQAETLDREQIAAVQLEGLKQTVAHVYQSNAIWRKRLRHSMITRSMSPGPSRSVIQACLLAGSWWTEATTCSAPTPYLGGRPFSR